MVVYQNDHIGTPQKITAVNGAVVWVAKYDSFGKATIDSSSTIENCLRFAGQYEDSETALYYNLHRYYDSLIGRYFKIDPIGIDGGINLFLYTNNNSINYIDPEGKAWRMPWTKGSWFNPICHSFTKSPCLDGNTHRFGEKYKAIVNSCDARLFPGHCRPSRPTNEKKWYQNGNCSDDGSLESASYTICKCAATCTGKFIVGEIQSGTAVAILKSLAKKYASAISGVGTISTVYSGFNWIVCSVNCVE